MLALRPADAVTGNEPPCIRSKAYLIIFSESGPLSDMRAGTVGGYSLGLAVATAADWPPELYTSVASISLNDLFLPMLVLGWRCLCFCTVFFSATSSVFCGYLGGLTAALLSGSFAMSRKRLNYFFILLLI